MRSEQLAFRNRFWRMTILLSRKEGIERPTPEILKLAHEHAESRIKEASA